MNIIINIKLIEPTSTRVTVLLFMLSGWWTWLSSKHWDLTVFSSYLDSFWVAGPFTV